MVVQGCESELCVAFFELLDSIEVPTSVEDLYEGLLGEEFAFICDCNALTYLLGSISVLIQSAFYEGGIPSLLRLRRAVRATGRQIGRYRPAEGALLRRTVAQF